jgi:heme exporter protein A
MAGDWEIDRPAAFAGQALACRRGARQVFEGLDFAVEPGSVLLLRGPNGSGKSSLLRLMAGLLQPDTGALSWAGARIAGEPERQRRRLAFLGHLDAVKPALTVAENLRFWCGDRAVETGLEAFGIAVLAGLPARLLSAGQRRRLALARVAASGAPLWLLDEPANALDAEALGLFARALARHRAGGGLAVIALHGESEPPGAATLDLARFAPAGAP